MCGKSPPLPCLCSLTPHPQSLGLQKPKHLLLITASDQLQNPFESVWEGFVGGAVVIDAKDKGSRASDTGWSVVLTKIFYSEF